MGSQLSIMKLAFAAAVSIAILGNALIVNADFNPPGAYGSGAGAVPASCYPNATGNEDWECLDGVCSQYEWRDEKSATTALLFAIFLGNAGGPLWYYNYTAQAAVMLCITAFPCALLCFFCFCMCCCVPLVGEAGLASGGGGGSGFQGFSGSGSGAPVKEDEEDPEIEIGTTDSTEGSGTGSGKGAGAGGEAKTNQEYLAQCCFCCLFCGVFIWAIVNIAHVADYTLYPQDAGDCLKKTL